MAISVWCARNNILVNKGGKTLMILEYPLEQLKHYKYVYNKMYSDPVSDLLEMVGHILQFRVINPHQSRLFV